jgi:predicted kinase
MTDRLPPGTFVVVSGPPASGKTTLSRAIAPAAGLPLIAKDTIKQALMTVLPVPDVGASRVVGRASVAALLAVAAESGGRCLRASGTAAARWTTSGVCRDRWSRCSAAATPFSRRSGTRCGPASGTPVTSTPNG